MKRATCTILLLIFELSACVHTKDVAPKENSFGIFDFHLDSFDSTVWRAVFHVGFLRRSGDSYLAIPAFPLRENTGVVWIPDQVWIEIFDGTAWRIAEDLSPPNCEGLLFHMIPNLRGETNSIAVWLGSPAEFLRKSGLGSTNVVSLLRISVPADFITNEAPHSGHKLVQEVQLHSCPFVLRTTPGRFELVPLTIYDPCVVDSFADNELSLRQTRSMYLYYCKPR